MTRWAKNLMAVAIAVVAGALIGTSIGGLVPRSGVSATGETYPVFAAPPDDALRDLQGLAPYPVRLPVNPPSGFDVEHLVWDEQPGGVFSIDAWYADPSGNSIHFWQSNLTDLREKDPVTGVAVETVNGQPWHWVELTDNPVATWMVSTRYDDVTVSIDTVQSRELLETFLRSLP